MRYSQYHNQICAESRGTDNSLEFTSDDLAHLVGEDLILDFLRLSSDIFLLLSFMLRIHSSRGWPIRNQVFR
jgi:hypothetical protein